MFTSEWRENLRIKIIEMARSDLRISGGAITGSMTVNQLDNWSDIDLAFGIRDSSELSQILEFYTSRMYQEYDAIHHLDVHSGDWVYRVFLLANTLQVDLAFVPEKQFAARSETFRLIFGKSGTVSFDPPTKFEIYVGWCWLYALHARSAIRRGRLWQAEFFVSGMRDHVVSLCCQRHGLPEKQGRGVDTLPAEELKRFEPTLLKSMQTHEVQRAFGAVATLCLEEIEQIDRNLSSRLELVLRELAM